MTKDEWAEQYWLNVGARGSDAIPEGPRGLNGPTGAVPEIEVTPAQIEAGRAVGERLGAGGYISTFVLGPVYRAMAAVAPPPNVGPSHLVALQRIATLEAENAELWRLIAFGDPTPGDRPDPPRRPDGTLTPAPKPWTPPKEQGPSRRVGA